MARIKPETIERIFETARIEEVVGEFVHLKRSGSNFKGLSPFTKEKTPSFYVVPGKQIFKDFSSGKGGSVVTFLMEHEQFSYPEALRWLAQRYNIEIEEEEDHRSAEAEQAAQAREGLYLINTYAQKYFEENLWETEEGRSIGLSYFRERGYTDETIRKFGLGYSLQGRDALHKTAVQKGYSEKALYDTGLCMAHEHGSHDRFWGRVMFPILSMSGRVLGFGGRILRSDAKAPKYLNSPESEIYHKSKVLYGLYESKREILRLNRCLLVEGYTDVISLHQAGVENVVSSSGTALTEDQIRLIRRLTPNITVLYDGDAAGIRASFHGIDMLLKEGLMVQVCLLPNGEDPDSYAKNHGGDAFKAFLEENAEDFVRFKTHVLLEDARHDPVKRAGLIHEIIQSVALVPDVILQQEYVRVCAQLLGSDEKVLFNELKQAIKRHDAEDEKTRRRDENRETLTVAHSTATPVVEDTAHLMPQEAEVLKILLLHGNDKITLPPSMGVGEGEYTVADLFFTQFAGEDIHLQIPHLAKVYSLLKELHDEGRWPSTMELLQHPDQEVTETVINLITEKERLSDWERKGVFVTPREMQLPEHAMQALLHYQERRLHQMVEQLGEQIKAEDQTVRQEALLKHMEAINLRKEINRVLNRVV